MCSWVQFQLLIALYIIWVTPIRVVRGYPYPRSRCIYRWLCSESHLPLRQGFDMQAQGFWFWMEGVMNLFFWAGMYAAWGGGSQC